MHFNQSYIFVVQLQNKTIQNVNFLLESIINNLLGVSSFLMVKHMLIAIYYSFI